MNKITVLFATVLIIGAVMQNCFKNIFVVFRLMGIFRFRDGISLH